MRKRIAILSIILICIAGRSVYAQGNYYNGVNNLVANGADCTTLRNALHDLIDDHTVRSYSSVLGFMCNNDVAANGVVLDRYNNNTSATCSGNNLPSSMNREHVMPSSWWGGSQTVTQFSDYFNLFPCDATVNFDKSNFPLGEVNISNAGYPLSSVPMTNIGTDQLNCTDNSSNTFDDFVFEPDDLYKGDFARIFLYMGVRYQDIILSENWKGSNSITDGVFSGNSETVFEACFIDMLLDWHNFDPPSSLEINRNNAIALSSNQGNRNPFVDHPEWADLIWNTQCSIVAGQCDLPLNCDFNPVPVTTNGSSDGQWLCTNGSYFINAFTNSNDPSEQWLVYGPVDLSAISLAELVLNVQEDFSGPALEFLFNTGSGNPLNSNWQSVGTVGTGISDLAVDYSAGIGNPSVYLGIKYTAQGSAGNTQSFTLSNLRFRTSCQTDVAVSTRVFLGACTNLSNGLMKDDLRSQGLIPTTEPYTGLGFLQIGGGNETVSNAVLALSGSNAIVDWILIELRDKNNPANILATRSALLQRDGDIVDTDGQSPVLFDVAFDDYYVAIRHRNHLGIMTSSPQDYSTGNGPTLDFSNGTITTFGSEAMRSIGTAQVMWPGNGNGDNNTTYQGSGSDITPITQAVFSNPLNTAFQSTYPFMVYDPADYNMDGQVIYQGSGSDILLITLTVFSNPLNSSFQLTFPIVEQLP